MPAKEDRAAPGQAKRWLKWGLIATIGLFALHYLLGSVWISPEIRARVVEENGKPIKDAVVLFVWMVKAPVNETNLGPIAMYEALTDENGAFVIPAWGPRFSFSGHLQQGEPEAYILHPDFYPLTESNLLEDAPLLRFAPVYIDFHKNGQAFQMKRFRGTPKEYEQAFDFFAMSISSVTTFPINCSYKQAPMTLAGLHKIKLKLEQQTGASNGLPSVDFFYQDAVKKMCGDAAAFFKGYLK